MESRKLECLLDSSQLFRARLDEVHQQQHRLCLESITIMVAQADLHVFISSVKRRKGATRYFQENEAEQCSGVDEKENFVAADTVFRGAQRKSCKASAAKTRKRRKPLVDSQAVNQSCQSGASPTCIRVVGEGEQHEDEGFQQQRGGDEELVHSMEGNKSTSVSVRGSEELVHSIEENNKRTSESVRARRKPSAGEAEKSVPNLGKPRTSRATLSIGRREPQVKTEVVDVDAPILTRARARNLQNPEGNVTMARGQPLLKKRRGRKGDFNSMSICPPADKAETAGKMQSITPLEQQSGELPPRKKSAAVKMRNTSQSPAVVTDGNVGKDGVTGQEHDRKDLKLENVSPNSKAEDEEEENIGKGRPSKKSKTSSRNTRLNSYSQAETDSFELGAREDAKATEHILPHAHASVEGRGGSPTNRSTEPLGNAALGEIVGNLGKFETVVTSENEDMYYTVANQPRTKSTSSKEGVVVVATSCPSHSDASTCNFTSNGAALHSMNERDGMDSSQEADMLVPSAQNGNALEVGIPCSSAKISDVEVADVDNVFALGVHGGTDSSPECLVIAEDPLLSRVESLLKDSEDAGSKPSSVVSSPSSQFVVREADILVLDHSQLKGEETSSMSEVPVEGPQVGEENEPVTEGHPGRGSSDSLAETDEIPDRIRRNVAHSIAKLSLAVELEMKETKTNAIGGESADVQSSAVSQTKEGMQLLSSGNSLEVIISPRDRDCNIVDQGEFHCSPVAALELLESVDVMEGKGLPGQLPQTQVTHRNGRGTPVRIERRLTQLLTTPEEVHEEELVDEETGSPGSHQLKFERNPLLENFAIGDSQGGLNSRTTSNVSDQADERAGGLQLVIPPALDVNPSVEPEGRKETAGGVQNSQMNVSLLTSPVEMWDRKVLPKVGGKADAASAKHDHRADEVGVQRYTDRSCELSVESELGRGEVPKDCLPDRERCARSPGKDGKGVGTFVALLEQASKPSKAVGLFHTEGSASIDFAPPSFTNAQYGSALRLSRLMSRRHVEPSFTVADAAGENSEYNSRRMKSGWLHDARDGLVSGSEIKKNGQQLQWTSNKVELVESGANNPKPFRIDESSVSLQNKQTTDVLLELCKRGGLQRSSLTAMGGPLSSELPGRNYTVDVIDEVYRSVVVRECVGNGAASSLTLPVTNWRSGIVHKMTGATPQCGVRLMETCLPLSDGAQVREVTEVDCPEGQKFDQEKEVMKPSPLIQEQEQDSVSAFANSGVVECSQETENDREVALESEELLSQEELNMSRPIPLSRVEEEPEVVSGHEDMPEDDVPVSVMDPSCIPVGSVEFLQQVVNSNIGNAQMKPFSNLVTGMKSFIPVIQQPPPSFLPDGKRVVKVKALMAAETARKAEENGDAKDRRLRKMRKLGENSSCGMEDEAVEASSRRLKESVEGGSKLDGEISCGSQLSPKRKVLLRNRSNSRNLFSPEAKSKQATNLENENKVKKNLAELKRIDEERKRKLLAMRQNKEELAKKNRQRQQGVLKQRKEQSRQIAEQEDKGQKHQSLEEAEREKKEMEEKSKQCTPKPREKENRQGEELKAKGAGWAALQAAAALARPGQTPGKIRFNLLGSGTLPLRSAVRVPVISKDKRTPIIAATALQKKGRHPSSSSSSSRLQSLNAEPTMLLSLNEAPARLPSVNAEPARLSSLNAASTEGGRHNAITHTFHLDNNRPTDVQHGGTGDSVSCTGTPCSEAVEKEADVGPTSYEMSPYRESDDEEDEKEQPAKVIPSWAKKENLNSHLLKQLTLDPDDIFAGSKTCSLKEVFGTTGSKKVQDFGKRSGSGDWFQDRVSWREELQYKINMGYVPQQYPS